MRKQQNIFLIFSMLIILTCISCDKEDNIVSKENKRLISKMDYYFPSTKTTKSLTKATAYQPVKSSNVYTFYSYTKVTIKPQTVSTTKKTFEVPVDDKDYSMLFIAKGIDSTSPTAFTILKSALDTINKTIKFTSKFNENICYKVINRKDMPDTKEVEVIFSPLFSQFELESPLQVEGKTLTIKEVKLLTGVQSTADVTIHKSTGKIDVNYAKVSTNYEKKLDLSKGTTWGLKDKYYNLIPNTQPFKLSITVELEGFPTQTKEISLNGNASLSQKTRYKLTIINEMPAGLKFVITTTSEWIDSFVEGWFDKEIQGETFK